VSTFSGARFGGKFSGLGEGVFRSLDCSASAAVVDERLSLCPHCDMNDNTRPRGMMLMQNAVRLCVRVLAVRLFGHRDGVVAL